MPRFDGWFDEELEDLFRDDPSLRDTAHAVRASHVSGEPDPGFRRRLRAELIAEAGQRLAPRRRRWALRLGAAPLAFGGAALGTALVAATAIALVSHSVVDHTSTAIQASSDVAAHHEVSPDTQVITIAFNQPMAEGTVVQGLRIRPATAVATSWQGNNLVITPLHHLAGNTPYTVSISKPALVAANGARANQAVQISFGTAPTPPAAPSPPALQPVTLGPAGLHATVVFAPDGGIVVTRVPGTATPSPTPSPTAVSTGSPSPSASPSASSSASPSPPPPAGPGAVEYRDGSSFPLGIDATALAFSPNGSTLAAATSDGAGGSDLVVAGADGSSPHTLVDSSAPVVGVTWVTGDRIAYATSTAVHLVDLTGATGPVVNAPSGYAGIAALAPGGGAAFLAAPPGGSGALLDVSSGATRELPGSNDSAAFSADGGTVVWVDRDSGSQQLAMEGVHAAAPTEVPTLAAGAPVTGLSVSADGRTVAYVQTVGGRPQLVLASLPTGAPIAVGPAPAALAFSENGTHIALVVNAASGPAVQRASVPGAASRTTTLLPPGASSALGSFVTAQVHDDTAALRQLSAASVDVVAATPRNLSRAYQIDAVASADGTVQGTVELIEDPTAPNPTPLIADEILQLSSTGDGTYQVTSLQVGPLHDESSGPHVMSVDSTSGSNGLTLINVSFDSDLAPGSVAPAVSLIANGETLNPASVTYDVDSRTLTVAVDAGNASQLELQLARSLVDVDGNQLAAPFSATVAAA